MSDSEKKRMERLRAWFWELRDALRDRFETLETGCPAPAHIPHASFVKEAWKREGGGGGEMSLLRDGRLFERAGVHASHVYGAVPDALRKGGGGEWASLSDKATFEAAGISVILHPRNPHVPAAHMNTRRIVIRGGDRPRAFFGGGADLTPMLQRYRDPTHKDTRDFHAALQEACAEHAGADYAAFRDNCDRYFRLPHRDENRGVGGIFYDGWGSGDFEADFALTRQIGEAFGEIYETLARRRMGASWSAAEKDEQRVWRGLYAEFNLLYDRGTRFGLQTGGNVRSILSALPPDASWR